MCEISGAESVSRRREWLAVLKAVERLSKKEKAGVSMGFSNTETVGDLGKDHFSGW